MSNNSYDTQRKQFLHNGVGLLEGSMVRNETLGSRIAETRTALGWSQGRLGGEVGVSRAAVSQWECDVHAPKNENLTRLAEALDRSRAWLLDGTSSPVDGSQPNDQPVQINPPVVSYGFLDRAVTESVLRQLFGDWVAKYGRDIKPDDALDTFHELYAGEIGSGSGPHGRSRRLREALDRLMEEGG